MFRRILNLAATVGIFGGTMYTYITYRTHKNMQEYKTMEAAGTLKDASRLTNDSFGISWGFQADDIVMKQIDSGDYLFIKYDCSECLDCKTYLQCFYDSALRLEQQYDCVGYAFRNREGLFIMFNQFGTTKILSYEKLVGLPYLKQLMIQKNSDQHKNIHNKLKSLFECQNGLITNKQFNENSIQMTNRINKYLFEQSGQYFEIWDLKQLLQSQKQIYVRTETNRTLRSL